MSITDIAGHRLVRQLGVGPVRRMHLATGLTGVDNSSHNRPATVRDHTI
ncbi:hypothetical protein [Tsukamurella sp. NPDC003166]